MKATDIPVKRIGFAHPVAENSSPLVLERNWVMQAQPPLPAEGQGAAKNGYQSNLVFRMKCWLVTGRPAYYQMYVGPIVVFRKSHVTE